MKTGLTIKNFKIFDEKGASFDISPITMLTGSNSSGKSTVVKALLLLNGFLSQIKNAIDNGDSIELERYKLDFSKYPNNLLGRFDKIVNDNSDSKKITLEYTMHSLMLSEDVTVQLNFTADENDDLNNGFLESLSMSLKGKIFYESSKKGNSYCNLSLLKDYCCNFLLAEYAIYRFCDSAPSDESYLNLSMDALERDIVHMKDFLEVCNVSITNDFVQYIRSSSREQSLIQSNRMSVQAIIEAKEKNSLFVTPIIDKLSQIPKNDVEQFVKFIVLKQADAPLMNASREVLDNYLASDFKSFGDFFRYKENLYLEHVNCDLFAFKEQLHLLRAEELKYLNNITRFCKKNDLIESDHRSRTFAALYNVVMAWNKSYFNEDKPNRSFDDKPASDPYGTICHHSFILLSQFVEKLLEEVICPEWSGNMSFVSSSRANVSRLYTLDDSSDFSLLLQNYFEKKRLFTKRLKDGTFNNRKYRANQFMNRWIKKFDIGDSITVATDKDGLGVSIRLQKNKKSKGRLLADEGYGITQLVSILLQIETAILSAKGINVNRSLRLRTLDHYDEDQFHYEAYTITIEEPEIHLHPKYQSLLADMFLEAYEKYNIHFIIETHSEYLIRKAQVFVARSNYVNEDAMSKENPFKVYYVPRGEKPYEMEFCADGRFKNEFGKGFFDEATNLVFEIL